MQGRGRGLHLVKSSSSLLNAPTCMFKVWTEAVAFLKTVMAEPEQINLAEFSRPTDLIFLRMARISRQRRRLHQKRAGASKHKKSPRKSRSRKCSTVKLIINKYCLKEG